jgi:hypothetical protein
VCGLRHILQILDKLPKPHLLFIGEQSRRLRANVNCLEFDRVFKFWAKTFGIRSRKGSCRILSFTRWKSGEMAVRNISSASKRMYQRGRKRQFAEIAHFAGRSCQAGGNCSFRVAACRKPRACRLGIKNSCINEPRWIKVKNDERKQKNPV